MDILFQFSREGLFKQALREASIASLWTFRHYAKLYMLIVTSSLYYVIKIFPVSFEFYSYSRVLSLGRQNGTKNKFIKYLYMKVYF